MDKTDVKILKILSENANSTATEIGNAVNLSIPAVNKRIAKLQSEGVIKNFTIMTDAVKVSKPITAFILIVLRSSSVIDPFLKYISDDTDVLECLAVTGEYDYIIKVCVSDVKSLEDKILYLKRNIGVLKSHTMLSLMEYKFLPTVLPGEGADD